MLPTPTLACIVAYERLNRTEDKALGDPRIAVPYYMVQTAELDNACGLIACIHSIFNNIELVSLEPDSLLDRFYLTTVSDNPEERATSLENMKDFQKKHKSYASKG